MDMNSDSERLSLGRADSDSRIHNLPVVLVPWGQSLQKILNRVRLDMVVDDTESGNFRHIHGGLHLHHTKGMDRYDIHMLDDNNTEVVGYSILSLLTIPLPTALSAHFPLLNYFLVFEDLQSEEYRFLDHYNPLHKRTNLIE
jgi:hypothetical protein